jgi:N-acetylglucosamine kinase-like BadF-type ATPase
MALLKLLADSGATKTEWRLVGTGSYRSFFTAGISPYHMDQAQISQLMLDEFPAAVLKRIPDAVFYYGTGCYTKPNAAIVKKAIARVFPKSNIEVTHDLMGAAIALCGGEKGIACILGTGSNSCFFDGKKIRENSPGLGYVLGDEGSGAFFGIKVIQHVLYGTFDDELMQSFASLYKTDKAEILHKVYKQPLANRYLAGFAKFLSTHRGHFMVENIIEDGLREFFDQHLCSYPKRFDVPIHFVGSIAFYFKDKIDELCKEYGFKRGRIIRQPMAGLVDFHQTNFLSKRQK